MDERPDPLAPPADDGMPLARVEAPCCPVHGRMTFHPENPDCPLMMFGARSCSCRPARFACGGLDGDECGHSRPVLYADWLEWKLG
jgi:hypothetical protein